MYFLDYLSKCFLLFLARYKLCLNRLVCEGILFGEAGEALLGILSIGVDTANASVYDRKRLVN